MTLFDMARTFQDRNARSDQRKPVPESGGVKVIRTRMAGLDVVVVSHELDVTCVE